MLRPHRFRTAAIPSTPRSSGRARTRWAQAGSARTERRVSLRGDAAKGIESELIVQRGLGLIGYASRLGVHAHGGQGTDGAERYAGEGAGQESHGRLLQQTGDMS